MKKKLEKNYCCLFLFVNVLNTIKILRLTKRFLHFFNFPRNRHQFSNSKILLALAELLDELGGDTLGALEGEAKGPVPVELGEGSDSARHSEEHCVVLELRESVVPQEDSGMRVNVGVGVLGLAVLGEDSGHDVVDGGDDLEEFVVGHVLEGELPLASVPGVGLAEDGVAVSGDDLLGVEGVPGELGDGLGVDLLALVGHLLLDALDPSEDLSGGERGGEGGS